MKYFSYFIQEREAAPSGLALLLVEMSFGGRFDQPVPIAMYWPIGQVVPYQRMHGNRHGLAKNAAKTDSQQFSLRKKKYCHATTIIFGRWCVYSSVELLFPVQQFVVPVQQTLADRGLRVPMLTPVDE
jgi:hypothetical protein